MTNRGEVIFSTVRVHMRTHIHTFTDTDRHNKHILAEGVAAAGSRWYLRACIKSWGVYCGKHACDFA